jgi:hypothetical protein
LEKGLEGLHRADHSDGEKAMSLKPSGGSSRNQTSTTTSEPPAYLRPYLQEGVQGASNLYNGGPAQYYPGQTVVGFSPETEQALGMQQSRAMSGNPVLGQANVFGSNLLAGKTPITFGGATNPHLDSMFNQAAGATQTRLASEFAGGGRNLAAARPARAEELGNLATSIYGGAYESERDRMASELGRNQQAQLGVLGMAPQLAASDYNDIDRLRGVGTAREELTGRQYEDAASRWDFGQNAQGTALDQYLARLNGYPGAVSSTSTPIYRNPVAGGLGGAMMGNQIGGQFGGNGGMWGSILGGLLGAYGS